MSSARYALIFGGIAILLIAIPFLLPSSTNEKADRSSVRTGTTSMAGESTGSETGEHGGAAAGEGTGKEAASGAASGRVTGIFGTVVSRSNTTNSSIYGFDFVRNSTWRVLDASPIYSFDFTDSGELYVTDSHAIYRIDSRGRVSEVHRFSKDGEISFLRLGPDGKVYFSRDGIYRLEGSREVKVLDVNAGFIDEYLKGNWDGSFAVDGEGNIYLSSGHFGESAIVKVTREGRVIPLVRVLKSVTAGLRYVDELTLNLNDGQRIDLGGTLMFTDGLRTIYFLDLKEEKPTLHFLRVPPLGEAVIWDLALGPAGS